MLISLALTSVEMKEELYLCQQRGPVWICALESHLLAKHPQQGLLVLPSSDSWWKDSWSGQLSSFKVIVILCLLLDAGACVSYPHWSFYCFFEK